MGDVGHPPHTDSNGNPRDWSGIPTTPAEVAEVNQHEAEEATATPGQFENAVMSAQQAFKYTFGDAAFQDATTVPPKADGDTESSDTGAADASNN